MTTRGSKSCPCPTCGSIGPGAWQPMEPVADQRLCWKCQRLALVRPCEHCQAGVEDEQERRLRIYLWLSHGHTRIYGDDGELQCGECAPFGHFDYRRAPMQELLDTLDKMGHDRMIKALTTALLPPASDHETP